MKSTAMRREIPENELELCARLPYVLLGSKNDVQEAGFGFYKTLAHGKADAADHHLTLPNRQLQMLLLTSNQGWCTADLYAARQQHRLWVPFAVGFELFEKLHQ